MMILRKHTAILAAMLIALSPGIASASPGWTNWAKITQINARETGLDLIITGTSNPMGCTNSAAFRLPLSATNYNVIASALLTAFSTKKNIMVWANQCEATDGVSLIVASIVSD